MSEKILEILVFVLGGSAYGLMEILFRGHTHWTMVITGRRLYIDAVPVVRLADEHTADLSRRPAELFIVTAYEFCVGMIVNVRLGWQVWDYSTLPGNIMGQICPVFTTAWFLLCLAFLGIVKVLT